VRGKGTHINKTPRSEKQETHVNQANNHRNYSSLNNYISKTVNFRRLRPLTLLIRKPGTTISENMRKFDRESKSIRNVRGPLNFINQETYETRCLVVKYI